MCAAKAIFRVLFASNLCQEEDKLTSRKRHGDFVDVTVLGI